LGQEAGFHLLLDGDQFLDRRHVGLLWFMTARGAPGRGQDRSRTTLRGWR
jgi:hypothetical protein